MQPCGVWKTTGVPAGKVNEVVAGYQLDNPTSIDKIDNHDGTSMSLPPFRIVRTVAPAISLQSEVGLLT